MAAGCGGIDSTDVDGDTASTDESLTKAQFISAADGICTSGKAGDWRPG